MLSQDEKNKRYNIMENNKLFSEFPPVSTEKWEEVIIKDLKGADYDKKLVWHPIEGFNVRPYYRAENLEGLDYLEPVTRRDDLAEVSAEEWQKMLDVLEESAGYGVILLDLGECVQGITEILKRCRHIFMPVLSDRYSEAKTEAFLTEMREAGEEVMVRGIRPVTMDQDEERLIAACSELIAHAGGRP